jgi:hypothetical protein
MYKLSSPRGNIDKNDFQATERAVLSHEVHQIRMNCYELSNASF